MTAEERGLEAGSGALARDPGIQRGPVWSAMIGLLSTRPLTFEEERRRLLFGAVAAVGGFMLVVFGVYHLLTGNLAEGIADLGVTAILAVLVVRLRGREDGRWYYRAGVLPFAVLFISFGLLSDHGNRALWTLTLPVFSILLAGRRTGTAISLVVLLWWILVFTMGEAWWGAVPYPSGFVTRFVACYFTVYLLTLFSEQVLHKYSEAQVGYGRALRELNRELAESEARMRGMAMEDPLTGAESRRSIEAYGEQLAARVRGGEGGLAVALLDVDRFKAINDQHGHAAGDAVLKECVDRIQRTLRPYDRMGRWGGEEFLLIFQEGRLQEVMPVLERIRRAVAGAPVVADGHRIEVTVSLGAAAATGPVSLQELLARADEALYRAKDGGRNRVVAGGAPS